MISTVRKHLLNTLRAAAGDVRVVTEVENFTPKNTDYPYIRFTFNPARSTLVDMSVSNDPQKQGFASFTYFNLRNKNAADEAIDFAEKLVSAFPVQNTLLEDGSQLLISDGAWVEGVRHEEIAFGVPVFVNWVNTGTNH